MIDNYGAVIVDITALKRKGDDLVVQGKVMGSLPGTFYLKPEELWSALGLLSWSVIYYVPVMLFKGWLRRRQTKSKPSAADKR